jgi:hypothetical protein
VAIETAPGSDKIIAHFFSPAELQKARDANAVCCRACGELVRVGAQDHRLLACPACHLDWLHSPDEIVDLQSRVSQRPRRPR